jgi:hypothetical protein
MSILIRARDPLRLPSLLAHLRFQVNQYHTSECQNLKINNKIL